MNGEPADGDCYPNVESNLDIPFSHTCNASHFTQEENNSLNYTELQSAVDDTSTESIAHTWQMNYHESAIYLEEGENNDKFDFHPRSKNALPAYLLVHNHWFYILDLLAVIILLGLAMCEKPAVPGFNVGEGIHASLELLCLSIMAVELVMKVRWMSIRPFFSHPRTVIKLVVVVTMIVESLVVLLRQTSHFRITRALRPIFLIDNHYCKGVRRVVRQILQSLPPILDMLSLLLFFMLIFSILGFYLFSSDPDNPHFSTLQGSFVNLFILLTTANFPDVMLPAYAKSKWSSLFFIVFLIINLYFLMNLMLAVVYETFTRMEKEKFRKLLLHRRKACQLAFHLLVSKTSPASVSFRHFEGLMKYYKPKACKRDVYLMFKTLDITKTGFLSIEEFYQVYEVGPLKWKPKRPEEPWFSNLGNPWEIIFRAIHQLVTWKYTDIIINIVILMNGIWQLIEAAELSSYQNGKIDDLVIRHVRIGDSMASWISVGFITFYIFEALLKMLGLGLYSYFRSGWNIYDFFVTIAGLAGLIAEEFDCPFVFVIILRPLRLLRLFKLKRRYRDVLGTLFIILPRFLSVALVLVVVYYFFAIIGMELFSNYNMKNCCINSTVEQFYHYDNDSLSNGYYYLNNFSNFVASGVTLFELMVVNNWFIIMSGYAAVSTEWSRIYFMIFYIITMVVINIVIAFVLEAFLFRIQYKRMMGDMDKDSLVKVDVSLTRDEIDFCYGKLNQPISHLMAYAEDLASGSIVYRGTRMRTKFSFSLKMYADEAKTWLEAAVQEEEKHKREVLSTFASRQENLESTPDLSNHHRTVTM
ncbi:two pore calcium channel protein 1-like [Centruroides vittatus]|uniref:two pore calcium channel protein 1-like n=1 Tax=Centruroides vittatus TaxID=120091 RepID=UPI003510A402